MKSEPSSGIKLIAYSCICWLFHRIYYDARYHKHKHKIYRLHIRCSLKMSHASPFKCKNFSPRIIRQADFWMCISYINHGVGILLKKCVNENCTFFENLNLLDKILEPSSIFEDKCQAKLFKIQFLRHKDTHTHTHTHTHNRGQCFYNLRYQ